MVEKNKLGNSNITFSEELKVEIDKSLKEGDRKKFEELTGVIQVLKGMTLDEIISKSFRIYTEYDKDLITSVNKLRGRKIDAFSFFGDSSLYFEEKGLGEVFLNFGESELNLDGIRCFYGRKQRDALEFQRIIKETGEVYLGFFGYNGSFFTRLKDKHENRIGYILSKSASFGEVHKP